IATLAAVASGRPAPGHAPLTAERLGTRAPDPSGDFDDGAIDEHVSTPGSGSRNGTRSCAPRRAPTPKRDVARWIQESTHGPPATCQNGTVPGSDRGSGPRPGGGGQPLREGTEQRLRVRR